MGHWTWPVGEGWLAETIPFPMEFAPQLPFTGTEELRFAPGFFTPDAPDHWSYVFVWRLEGRPALDAAALAPLLRTYWAGLCEAVGAERFAFDPGRYEVRLRRGGVDDRTGHRSVLAFGSAAIYDAFSTDRPVTLRVRTEVWDCEPSQRRLMLLTASPSRSRAVRDALASCGDAFRCH